MLCATCTGISLVTSLEELVAGIDKLLPQLIAQLARHNTNLLPFLLQVDEFVTRLAPFSTCSEFFSLFDESFFLFGIGSIFFFQYLEVFCFLGEELIVGSAEALKYLHVHLLRSETYLLPFALQLDNLLGDFLPFGSELVLLLVDGFYLLAECSLLLEVFLLLGTQLLEVLLMLLVDNRAGSLEPAPYLLTQLLGHWAYLAILCVEFLQLVEGRDNIFFLVEFLGSLAELGLCLKILLEVVFTSLVVELQQVVELLYVELIAAPELVGLVGRNGLYLFPFLLQGFKFLI